MNIKNKARSAAKTKADRSNAKLPRKRVIECSELVDTAPSRLGKYIAGSTRTCHNPVIPGTDKCKRHSRKAVAS